MVAGFSGAFVVLVTRPDLVLVVTLGVSTIAGACQSATTLQHEENQLTTAGVLRGLAVLALGFAAVFLVPAFLVVALAAGLRAAVFLAAVVLVVFFS